MVLAQGMRMVTYEDSTVAQARESYPWPHLQGLTEADLARYTDRQRRAYRSARACCCTTHWVAREHHEQLRVPPSACSSWAMARTTRVGEVGPRDWARLGTCSSASTGSARTDPRFSARSRASENVPGRQARRGRRAPTARSAGRRRAWPHVTLRPEIASGSRGCSVRRPRSSCLRCTSRRASSTSRPRAPASLRSAAPTAARRL